MPLKDVIRPIGGNNSAPSLLKASGLSISNYFRRRELAHPLASTARRTLPKQQRPCAEKLSLTSNLLFFQVLISSPGLTGEHGLVSQREDTPDVFFSAFSKRTTDVELLRLKSLPLGLTSPSYS